MAHVLAMCALSKVVLAVVHSVMVFMVNDLFINDLVSHLQYETMEQNWFWGKNRIPVISKLAGTPTEFGNKIEVLGINYSKHVGAITHRNFLSVIHSSFVTELERKINREQGKEMVDF